MAEAPVAGVPPADAPAARPKRASGTAFRLRQLSFGSQVKAVLVLAIPTTILLFVLFTLLELAGFFRNPSDGDLPFIFMVLILTFVSGFFAAIIVVLQIAALCLLRFVPWPGPELKVEEPRHLAGIFD